MGYCRRMSGDAHPPEASGFPATLVRQVLDDALRVPSRPCIFAIAGLQGSGKSTLAAQVVDAAIGAGLAAATVSIDDFYLTRAQRRALAAHVHPLLATRGPPGTHALPLALSTLDALRAGGNLALPRFDKLADDRAPAAQWPTVNGRLDLLVIEGWFLGTPAQDADALAEPINALERDEDPDGTWRRWCNDTLARDYPALWARFDRLWFLQGPDFDIVPQWRWQQEQALQAAQPQRRGMTRTQLDCFVQFYERVSRQALRTLPAIADRTIALDDHRHPL